QSLKEPTVRRAGGVVLDVDFAVLLECDHAGDARLPVQEVTEPVRGLAVAQLLDHQDRGVHGGLRCGFRAEAMPQTFAPPGPPSSSSVRRGRMLCPPPRPGRGAPVAGACGIAGPWSGRT